MPEEPPPEKDVVVTRLDRDLRSSRASARAARRERAVGLTSSSLVMTPRLERPEGLSRPSDVPFSKRL
jgi:hypothetical protein